MAYADSVRGSRRLPTIAGVAALHAVIGYAFVSGMAVDVAGRIERTFTTTNIPVPVPPPVDTPPPPKQALAKTQAPQHSEPPVTASTAIDAPASSWTVPVTTFPLDPPVIGDLLPPQPQPSASASPDLARGAAVRGDRAAWITNDDYPPAAIRAEEQGTVGSSVAIGTNGRVTSCRVTAPSGSSALDQATCRLYAQRARFTPARDAAGTAMEGSYSDRVRWYLPR